MDEAKGLHILTEIYKFSFSMKTMLADPEFVPSVQKVPKAASDNYMYTYWFYLIMGSLRNVFRLCGQCWMTISSTKHSERLTKKELTTSPSTNLRSPSAMTPVLHTWAFWRQMALQWRSRAAFISSLHIYCLNACFHSPVPLGKSMNGKKL